MKAAQDQITIHEVDYHRNGIAGVGFYAVAFTDHDAEHGPAGRTFVATVFPPDPHTEGPEKGEPDWDSPHNPRIALIAVDLLPKVTFGINSWRGDNYQATLYAAIQDYRSAW